MSSGRIITQFPRQVKPVLSTNRQEARIRVLNLYRAWYRSIPYMVHDMRLPLSTEQLRNKIREKIVENAHITDIRVIDMLVIKSQMELTEAVNKWKQECHIMDYFKETVNPRPKDFMSKFLAGQNSE